MRTSVATVCLSGGLTEKLHACASAGFDGVEIMDADLIGAYESPEEIRTLCERLGLTIDMFQPFRDVEGVDEELFLDNLRRAEAKFDIMERLGTDLILLCSNAGTATIDDDDLAADQLGRLADRAARRGIRIAYEALAWGRFVDDYRRAWDIVKKADRPNLGVCLDSFHILSRGHDPSDIESIPGDRIFFLQLADAPALDMDVLQWSRHHRLFPGEGDFDLTGFLGHVLRAGYTGPLSLEVFNDTFRQTDVVRTAAHARRSLTWLADRTADAGHAPEADRTADADQASDAGQAPEAEPAVGADRAARPDRSTVAADTRGQTDRHRLIPPQHAHGIDFVEISGDDLHELDQLLDRLGFAFRGRHRSKPVRLWTAGGARIILNEQLRLESPRLTAFGLTVDDAAAASERAALLGADPVYRRTYSGEVELRAVASPDGTEVYWNDEEPEASWVAEFEGGVTDAALTGDVDHINVSYAWQDFDEAVLFMRSVVALDAEPVAEVPGPRGLVRSQVMRSPDRVVRLPMNLAPPTAPVPHRHIAVRVTDVVAAARAARDKGLEFLPVPHNYYDDLQARFALDAALLETLQELDLLYDRDAHGEFIHFYTPTFGGVFLELVERRGGYDGYGAPNAPVRLSAQRQVSARSDRRGQGAEGAGV